METLSPTEHLQAPVEVRFPFCHEQLKVVQPLLQLYCTMYLHAFSTGGRALRVWQRGTVLSIVNQNNVDGGI